MAKQVQNPTLRKTLIKHMIGKVRTCHYLLPEDHFVFGIANKLDREGAAQVISSWAHVEPSKQLKSKCPSSSTTHRETARKGQGKDPRKASAQSSLTKSTLKSSANIREPETDRVFQGQELSKDSWTPSLDCVYGIKSFANDMSMKELLKRCSPDHVDEKDYPDRSNMKKKGQLPPAKSTKASRMYVEAIHPQENLENKSQFKMQKFLKIESKVKNLYRQ